MDDFLASMGITPEEPPQSSQQLLGDAEPTVTVPEQPQQTHELTASDFNDILDDLGFNPPDAEAEEIVEDENEYVRDVATDLLIHQPIADNAELMEAIRTLDENGYISHSAIAVSLSDDGTHLDITYRDGSVRSMPLPQPENISIQQEVHTAPVTDHVHLQTLAGQWADVPIVQEEAPVESGSDGNIPITDEETQDLQSIDSAIQDNSYELLIPENSPTLTTDTSTSRFSGAEWYELVKEQQIIIGGAGGIGSWLAFQVARLSPSLIALYDDDIVETGNLSGQLFSRLDVNKTKVKAIESVITKYNEHYCVHGIPSRFTEYTEAGDVMMCGFDNMEARKTFFRSWLSHVYSLSENKRKECLFLDGRLSMNVLQVFCITGDDSYSIQKYSESYLFDDADADETICSMKQTTYMACMIGSIMTNLFVNFVANLTDPVLPYDLPFFTEYDAQNMIFKTEK